MRANIHSLLIILHLKPKHWMCVLDQTKLRMPTLKLELFPSIPDNRCPCKGGEDTPDWNWWASLLIWSRMDTCNTTAFIFFTCCWVLKPHTWPGVAESTHPRSTLQWDETLTDGQTKESLLLTIFSRDIEGCKWYSLCLKKETMGRYRVLK